MKNLFTVHKGEKVTERLFKRVLISSVCGILLCMSCLMTTTWAWFTSTVEKNIGPITVASHRATIYEGGTESPEKYVLLEAGDAAKELQVVFVTDADPSKDSFKDTVKPHRYIVMTVYVQPDTLSEQQTGAADSWEYYSTVCFAATDVGDGDLWYVPLKLTTGVNCKLVFESAWRIPAGNDVISVALKEGGTEIDGPILMEVIAPVTTSATETTAASEPSASVPATTEPEATETKATETKATEPKTGESEKTENE